MARKLLWAAKIDFPQRSRSSTGNVRRAAAVSALMFGCTVLSQSAAPADSECKVTDFFVNELVPKLQSARAASTVVQIVHHAPPNASGGMPASVGADAAPARDEAQAIRLTIEQRDLNAFIRALPADADLRRVALLKSVALDHAFRNGALAIVRQILDWQPDALAASPIRTGSQLRLSRANGARCSIFSGKESQSPIVPTTTTISNFCVSC